MQNSKANTYIALALMGITALGIVVMFVLASSSASPSHKTKAQVSSAPISASQAPNVAGSTTTDDSMQEDHGAVNAGSYQGSMISFPMPAGFSNLQQVVGQGQERVDFDVNAEHQTVRVGTQALSDTAPSLTDLVTSYVGQGQIAQKTFGGRKTYVVTSASSGEVSLLALAESEAQLVTVQVVTTPTEKAAGEQLLGQLVAGAHVDATSTTATTTPTTAG
jgi:hypothetical protein